MNLIFEKVPHVQCYSDLHPFVAVFSARLNDYIWRFDSVEANVMFPNERDGDDYWLINGDEFANLVKDHPQFEWAVVSAIPRCCVAKDIKAQCYPYADGNPSFWTGVPKPQHPFAEFEIVCWDASATLLIGADEAIAAAFRTAYPESMDLDRENAIRDRTK